MLITTRQAAERLGVSHRRVRALVFAGRIPVERITTRLFLIDEKNLLNLQIHEKYKPKAYAAKGPTAIRKNRKKSKKKT